MIIVGNSAIVNADDEHDTRLASGLDLFVLTCGLQLNSTVTASSIEDDGFMFCLQRGIFTINGRQIPPQEFKVGWTKKPDDIFGHLAVVTLMLLCGTEPELFKIIRF